MFRLIYQVPRDTRLYRDICVCQGAKLVRLLSKNFFLRPDSYFNFIQATWFSGRDPNLTIELDTDIWGINIQIRVAINNR